MREIKFRAWDKDFKRMLCPAYIERSGIAWGENSWTSNIFKNQYEVMQFTGLHDKNGKEIWEGDVVRWDDESNGKYWRVCVIEWEKAHYKLTGYTFDTDTPDVRMNVEFKFGQFIYEYDGVLEVIGNVFENHELLEVTPAQAGE